MANKENDVVALSGTDDYAENAGRRTLLVGGLALGAFGTLPRSGRAMTKAGPSKGADVVLGAAKCVVAGDLCISHCMRLIATGDTSMAKCLESAMVMTSVCKTMMTLAAVESPVFKQMGSVAMATCEACRAECERHAMHHAECEACMVACRETLDVLKGSELMKM